MLPLLQWSPHHCVRSFVLHLLGYLLLNVSQTIPILLHGDPQERNSPTRASQESVGAFMALGHCRHLCYVLSSWQPAVIH